MIDYSDEQRLQELASIQEKSEIPFYYCGVHSPVPWDPREDVFDPFTGRSCNVSISKVTTPYSKDSRDVVLGDYPAARIQYDNISSALDSKVLEGAVLPSEISFNIRGRNCSPSKVRFNWIHPSTVELRTSKLIESSLLRKKLKKEAREKGFKYFVGPSRNWLTSKTSLEGKRSFLNYSVKADLAPVLNSSYTCSKFLPGYEAVVTSPEKYSGEIVEILSDSSGRGNGSKYHVHFKSGNFEDAYIKSSNLEPLDRDIYNPLNISLVTKKLFRI